MVDFSSSNEQNTSTLTQQQDQQQQATASATPAQASSAVSTFSKYSWLKPSQVDALTKYFADNGHDDELAAATAKLAALDRFEHPKNGSGIMGALNAVGNVAGRAISDVAEPAARGAAIGLGATTGIVQDTFRQELHNWRHPQGSVPGLEGATQTKDYADIGSQSPAIQAAKQLATDPSKVDIGSGFGIGGSAKATADANALAIAPLDGAPATIGSFWNREGYKLGSAIGSGIVGGLNYIPGVDITAGKAVYEPGSLAAGLAKGSIDAAVEFATDPVNRALTGVHLFGSESLADNPIGQVTSDADLAKMADKAGAVGQAWKDQVLIGGTRDTVVPSAVDKMLLSPLGQSTVERSTASDSAVDIWRNVFKKEGNPALMAPLAEAATLPDTLAILRSEQGLGVGIGLPDNGFLGHGAQLVNSLESSFRWANIIPQGSLMDTTNPVGLINEADRMYANANILANDPVYKAGMNRTFDYLAGKNNVSYYDMVTGITDDIRNKIAETTGNSQLADAVTRWRGSTARGGESSASYAMDAHGVNINGQNAIDNNGNPLTQVLPFSTSDVLQHTIPVIERDKIDLARRLTGRISNFTESAPVASNVWKPGRAIGDVLTQEIFKGLNHLRPAMMMKIMTDHTARAVSAGIFDDPADMAQMLMGRGSTLKDGELADIADEYLRLGDKIAAGDGDTAAMAQRQREIQDALEHGTDLKQASMIGGVNQFDAATGQFTRASGNRSLLEQLQAHDLSQSAVARADKMAQPHNWVSGMGDTLLRWEANDPTLARAANGGLFAGDSVDGAPRNGVDGIGDWLHHGAGQKEREIFQELHPNVDYADQAVVDREVADQAARVQTALGDNLDLRQAVATGKLPANLDGDPTGVGAWVQTRDAVMDGGKLKSPAEFGRVLSIDGDTAQVRRVVFGGDGPAAGHVVIESVPVSELKSGEAPLSEAASSTKDRALSQSMEARLHDYRLTDPNAPQQAVYKQTIEGGVRWNERGLAALARHRDAATTAMFQTFTGTSQDRFLASPMYNAEWHNAITRMAPFADPADHAQILQDAATANLGPVRLDRLAHNLDLAGPDAKLTYDEMNLIAAGQAHEKVLSTFFNSASDRTQLANSYRNLAPYADVWRNQIKFWASAVADQPVIARKVQLAVNGAVGSGFMHPDPTRNGAEMFSYPLPGPVASLLGVNYTANILGTALGTSVTPGLGPAASILVSDLAPHNAEANSILDTLMPYGRPTTTSTADTIMSAIGLPSALTKVALAVQGSYSDREFANTWMESFSQQVADGKVPNTKEGIDQAWRDSKMTARLILGLRGLIQAFAPAAPSVDYHIATKGGDEVAAVLAQKYADLRTQEQAGKIPDATGAFINQYGQFAYVYMSGKTKSVGPTGDKIAALGSSRAFGDWESSHMDFVNKYPSIAGYFGPNTGSFDPLIAQWQTDIGQRVLKQPEERLKDAQTLIADYYVRQDKAKLPANPSTDQKAWLASRKADLAKKFPLWDPTGLSPIDRQNQIVNLQQAVQDPKEDIGASPTGQAVKLYLAARDEAIRSAGSPTKFATGNGAVDIRNWLRSKADQISTQYPSFTDIYHSVLENEMKDDKVAGP